MADESVPTELRTVELQALSGEVIYSTEIDMQSMTGSALKQQVLAEKSELLPPSPNADPSYRMRIFSMAGKELMGKELVCDVDDLPSEGPITLQLLLMGVRNGRGVLIYNNSTWWTGVWVDDKQDGIHLGFQSSVKLTGEALPTQADSELLQASLFKDDVIRGDASEVEKIDAKRSYSVSEPDELRSIISFVDDSYKRLAWIPIK